MLFAFVKSSYFVSDQKEEKKELTDRKMLRHVTSQSNRRGNHKKKTKKKVERKVTRLVSYITTCVGCVVTVDGKRKQQNKRAQQ